MKSPEKGIPKQGEVPEYIMVLSSTPPPPFMSSVSFFVG